MTTSWPAAERRVVITGVGPITAIGTGSHDLWESVLAGRSGVVLKQQKFGGVACGSFPVAAVPEFSLTTLGLPSGRLRTLMQNGAEDDIDLQYLVAASHLAIQDSGLRHDPDQNRVALVLTHENPGMDRYVGKVLETALRLSDGGQPGRRDPQTLFTQLYRDHSPYVYGTHSFLYLHRVARVLGVHGPSLFINNACASGLYAIEAAALMIRSGQTEAAVVAGADHPLLITKFLWFDGHGLYARDGVMRPFDDRRSGLVLGDGAAAVVLEDFEAARDRGARIYAEYMGGGFNQEAWKVTMPCVSGDYCARAFRDALERTGVKAEEIDLVNPHGTATALWDAYEARTLTSIFGKGFEKPLVTALKPYVGHMLGASALAEVVILLLAMEADVVPATLNCERPDAKLAIRPVRETSGAPLRTVVKMSSGFGGFNAVGVFRKVTVETADESQTPAPAGKGP
ncbi:MAG TPA: beta-ketoacyl-[acyl-carrier-protein] synthase family protein [Candidatus Dormibacteraeota bacterium]|nr:beta-ketoacyl-[acyl-carrier-protein] synthase family protein [Candidatus Dormibacteraeota bacterium]